MAATTVGNKLLTTAVAVVLALAFPKAKPQPTSAWTQTPGFAFGGGDAPPPTERLSKGTNSVTKNQDGQWQTPEEMAAMGGGPGGPGGGFGGRRGGGMFGGAMALPADTATNLASLTKGLKEENGVISGDLTEDGAKAQLSFGRRGGRGPGGGGFTPPEPTNAKGSVKFWVTDGVLTKYELKITGTMSFGGNNMDIDRTTTVEFSNVGSTKVDAPAEAIKKIGG